MEIINLYDLTDFNLLENSLKLTKEKAQIFLDLFKIKFIEIKINNELVKGYLFELYEYDNNEKRIYWLVKDYDSNISKRNEIKLLIYLNKILEKIDNKLIIDRYFSNNLKENFKLKRENYNLINPTYFKLDYNKFFNFINILITSDNDNLSQYLLDNYYVVINGHNVVVLSGVYYIIGFLNPYFKTFIKMLFGDILKYEYYDNIYSLKSSLILNKNKNLIILPLKFLVKNFNFISSLFV